MCCESVNLCIGPFKGVPLQLCNIVPNGLLLLVTIYGMCGNFYHQSSYTCEIENPLTEYLTLRCAYVKCFQNRFPYPFPGTARLCAGKRVQIIMMWMFDVYLGVNVCEYMYVHGWLCGCVRVCAWCVKKDVASKLFVKLWTRAMDVYYQLNGIIMCRNINLTLFRLSIR